MERLLDYFTPENYKLTLNINRAENHVRGKVVITGTPLENRIKFHAENLKISTVKLGENPVDFAHENGELIIKLPKIGPKTADSAQKSAKNAQKSAKSAKIQLEINYTFTLGNNMEGAYLSTYQQDGETFTLVTTQFESHYARQAFPCIDEPAAKATFDLKIITSDPTDTVLSNMPARREEVVTYKTVSDASLTLNAEKTVKIAEFETTPKMSTYLLAFVVGPLQKYESENNHGVKITTYAAKNQDSKKLKFPTEIAAEALDYYDNLFGTKYPLEKLDQVAIPDFEAGAMENWGLVTYRESCLLADDSSSEESKQYIATVITHELSHQWFGDLVTMSWWDDLWLNESFASVMQYMSVDDLHPDWGIWEDFYTSDCYAALRRDALPGVQAVKQAVNDPAEIATLFDGAIVYAKGAHLIFMLIRLMSRENFFKGVKDYFKKHAYGNTIGDDLWAALQPYADFDVKDFMDAWISQPGYPVITPDAKTPSGNSNAKNQPAQSRFLFTGETDSTTWPLPDITDDLSGHYLINLDRETFEEKFKNFADLSLEQRLRLLIDRQLLAKTDLASPADLLDLLPKFKTEKSAAVWEILNLIMGELKVFFPPEESELHEKYQRFVLDVITPRLTELGLDAKPGEGAKDAQLRSLLVSLALYAEDPEITRRLAEKYTDDLASLDPDLRSDILTAKLRVENEDNFAELLDLYRATPDPDLRADLLSAFTDAKNHNAELLALLEDSATVRPQDHVYLFADLLFNHSTRQEAYDWFYSHWDYISRIAGEKSLDDYLRIAAGRVVTPTAAEDFKTFFKAHENNPALARGIAVAKTDISARLAWITRNRASVTRKIR